MGAGIPLAVPAALEALTRHEPVEYPVYLLQADGKTETFKLQFDPARFMEGGSALPELKRPDFLPIVSSETLASVLLRKIPGGIDGFIVESNVAGGHNAPPRGVMTLNADAEPVYGVRDNARLEKFRDMGLPFWLAGAVGTPEGLRYALSEGAAGVQVGTAFALCTESGLLPEIRTELLRGVLAGEARVFTDFAASPTGFPFKVARLAGSLSEKAVYEQRRRVCDIGFLRQPFRREDGTIAYRCPAEPAAAYVAKGGRVEETVGRKCLCNALAANMGMAQKRPDGTYEKSLVTMGDTLTEMGRFCSEESLDFSARDVVNALLEKG
jgi:nitronate monooxygenase